MNSAMTIWRLVREAESRARHAGASHPISTRTIQVSDKGTTFLVRVVEGLARKPISHLTTDNPFLPFDPAMFVTDIPPRHVGLLNKYPVLDHHLLMVTREFEEQLSPLTQDDFHAMAWCLASAAAEREGLVFFNGGHEAGASQRHKHMQMVPTPLASDQASFPLEPLLRASSSDELYQSDEMPFEHSLAQFGQEFDVNFSPRAHQFYTQMLMQLDLWSDGEPTTRPYNLLLTRKLMFLVPRTRESFEGISINALAFAGALLVRNDHQVDKLTDESPWAALAAVSRKKI